MAEALKYGGKDLEAKLLNLTNQVKNNLIPPTEWIKNLIIPLPKKDFKKVFDSVDRSVLFDIIRNYGIPDPITNAIKILYTNTKSAVLIDGQETDKFNVNTGVLQGDVLAPFLFIIVIDWIMYNSDIDHLGFITSLRRSRRKPAVRLSDLEYADDIGLLEDNQASAQEQLNWLSQTAKETGLIINAEKTKFLTRNLTDVNIDLDGQALDQVNDFQYLGSFVGSTENDFKHRKGKAWAAFWELKNIWKSTTPLELKVNLFKAAVLSVLLYGSESWVINENLKNRINSFQTTCLRIILGISNKDHIRNEENSIRHNLSLHSCFVRVQNEGTGKSSWWTINPDGGKGGKAPRRRAVSMDNSSNYTKSRGCAAKKKAGLQVAQEGGSDSPSGPSKWPGSPTSRSIEDLDAWTDFRSRTSSSASTLSGRLSPILANPELDGVPDDDDPPLSPMLYSGPSGTSPSMADPSPAELPRLADLTGTMNLNNGLHDDLLDDLLDDIGLTPPREVSPGGSESGDSAARVSSLSAAGYASSIFGPPSLEGLRPLPMQTIQENRQSSFTCGARFSAQTLQDLLGSAPHCHSDVMMTQSDPLMSQASAAVSSQNPHCGVMLRSDPMMSSQGGSVGKASALRHQAQYQSSLSAVWRASLAGETSDLVSLKQQVQSPGTSLSMHLGSSDSSSYSGLQLSAQERFPSDLDLDIFTSSLDCDVDSIVCSELMDADGLDLSLDSLTSTQNAVTLSMGGFTSAKQATSQSWVPS
ncbi:hypothetical protein SKAU_G00208460 [Synaphobranchus kaupii]|uniref:Fork-head domain-containing protein n=1 Tax=Synaphobranchus kaupii TaxID=118154 RepID=A0A9Q1F8F3_SYNKA|nr:hypothetical protein SKAU_G00208460 [Synaphobranchus kaupii]